MTEIVVDMNDGSQRTVSAVTYGHFAIHRSLRPHRGFTVTHRLTGLACCLDAPSESAAMLFARRLQRLPVNWQVTCEANLSLRSKALARECRDRCRGEWKKPVASGRAPKVARKTAGSPRRRKG